LTVNELSLIHISTFLRPRNIPYSRHPLIRERRFGSTGFSSRESVSARAFAGLVLERRRRPPETGGYRSGKEADIAVRNDFAVAGKQTYVIQSPVQRLQPSVGNRRKDVVFEVELHSCSHEMVLDQACHARTRNPMDAVDVAEPRVKVLGDCLQTKDHWIHTDDGDEPEDNVEEDAPSDALKQDELSEDHELGNEFSHEKLRSSQQAGGCSGLLRCARDPSGRSAKCRNPE